MDKKTPSNDRQVDALKRQIAKQEAELDTLKGKALTKVAKTDDAFAGFSGKYKDIRTGEIVALKVLDAHEVRFLRTHLVKGEKTSGDYTAADFRRLFDKL